MATEAWAPAGAPILEDASSEAEHVKRDTSIDVEGTKYDVKQRYNEEHFTSQSTKIQGLGVWTLLHYSGVHDAILGMSWTTLVCTVFFMYACFGALSGFLLYTLRDIHSSAEHLLEWWYRGALLLLMNVVFDPDSPGQKAFTSSCCFVGACVNLLLFGLVYEKWCARKSTMVFSKRLMLRQLPAEMGGYMVLTFRYAEIHGHTIYNAVVKASVIRRVRMPGGDHFIFPHTLRIRGFGDQGVGMPTVPGAFFFHHIIDEASPFFDPINPWRCNFSGFMRIFLSVAGTGSSQENHVGGTNWGFACIELNKKFGVMLKTPRGKGRQIDFHEFDHVLNVPPQGRIAATLSDLGLPTEPTSNAAAAADADNDIQAHPPSLCDKISSAVSRARKRSLTRDEKHEHARHAAYFEGKGNHRRPPPPVKMVRAASAAISIQ